MLDNEKIGAYVVAKRKALGLTQRELGDLVGVSDKAVSKWERGKSLPDNHIIEPLCKALGISVNEFLSGEDIVKEEYTNKAEKSMLSLTEDNIKQKRAAKGAAAIATVGFLLLFLSNFGATLNVESWEQISYIVDVPALFSVIGMGIVVLAFSGNLREWLEIFGLLRKKNQAEVTDRHLYAVLLLLIGNAMGGFVSAVGEVIIALLGQVPGDKMVAVLAISMLPLFYAGMLDIVWIVIYSRLKKKRTGDKNINGENESADKAIQK